MSESRAQLLERLRSQTRLTSLAALVALTGLHRNTVREHMDALLDAGLVTRERAPSRGRGRPAWLYAATNGPEPGGDSEYAGLAGALASVIERTSARPAEDAIAAGAEWGRDLAEKAGRPAEDSPLARRRQVVKVFDVMGFEPEADEDAVDVRLTRCPLLEVAYRHPDVVCNVHLGIVRGAMAAYGTEDAASELHPFAEPGACRLRLHPTAPGTDTADAGSGSGTGSEAGRP